MIEQYFHHDPEVLVSVQPHLKGKHREYCLCWKNCAKFKPEDRKYSCKIADILFAMCVTFNIVTPVWECPDYVEKTEDDVS